MNNRGFTLIELLASIVILAIIMAIAVPGVNSISSAIRKNDRQNNIKNIEIAASKYAYDTGKTLVFVDELVKEGYLLSDDDSGNINDTYNNSRLNCYVVEMTKHGDYYDAKFLDDNNYEVDGVCDNNKLQELQEDIAIVVLVDGKEEDNLENWYRGLVTLRAYSNSVIIDCVNNRCTWQSSSGANKTGIDEVTLNNAIGSLKTTYTFSYTMLDKGNNELKRYQKSVNLKIDNEEPKIYENETKITNRYIYSDKKQVTIEASDGKGSGIAGYYLGLDSETLCLSDSLAYQESNVFTVNKSGSYTICVKDKVGNVSSYKNLQISYFL